MSSTIGTTDEGAVPRILVITAYYKEERALIERTIRSVAAQTAATKGRAIVDHMLVADGYPQDWIDGAGVRHVRLDRGHGDYGNTPRGVGSALAIVEGYDAFCYCDADNWYEPGHVEACLDAAAKGGDAVDYVIARRTMRRPDESVIKIADEPIENHVDTNCFFFLPGSFHLVHHFAAIPRQMSIIGDRLFFAVLKAARLKVAVIGFPTVAYLCLWEAIYRAIGEVPPADAKPSADYSVVDRWLRTLTDRERLVVSRRAGIPFRRPENEPEPLPSRVGPPRVLVITAYYKEDRAMIEKAIASVRAQTAAAKGLAIVDQMLVADGFPQGWIDEAGLRHVKLDRAHGDYGNTPRGVGSLLAISEDWDAICWLDADNWLEPNHVEACLARAAEIGPDCDWVMARRIYRRPDGSLIPIRVSETDIDTNCFFFLPGSYHLLHHFAAQPKEIAIAGDQVFHQVLTAAGLNGGRVEDHTVDYLCLWENIYRLIGEEPPEGARPPAPLSDLKGWLDGLEPKRRRVVGRLIGIDR